MLNPGSTHALQGHWQLLLDFSVRSGAGDQDHEELPVCRRQVVTVHGLTCGLAQGGAMHDGTPHRVLLGLVCRHRLRRGHSWV